MDNNTHALQLLGHWNRKKILVPAHINITQIISPDTVSARPGNIKTNEEYIFSS